MVVAGSGVTGQPMPSELLADGNFVEQVRQLFEGVTFGEVDKIMKERADGVLHYARLHFWEHKFVWIENLERHSHWLLVFFKENLTRLCAILALAGHIKADVKSAKRDTCLLARANKGAFEKVIEGEYETLFKARGQQQKRNG